MNWSKDPKNPFSTRLLQQSKKQHDVFKRSILLRAASALGDRQTWASLLADFCHIYFAMEAMIEKYSREEIPEGQKFAQVRGVFRSAAFQSDLLYYCGGDVDLAEKCKREAACRLPVKNYLHRMHLSLHRNPSLMTAYAHSMFLALLAGGAILKRALQKAQKLPCESDEGIAIFSFSQGEESRQSIRHRLESAVEDLSRGYSEEVTREIIEEKRIVFLMNNEIISRVPISIPGLATVAIRLMASRTFLITVLMAAVLLFAVLFRVLLFGRLVERNS